MTIQTPATNFTARFRRIKWLVAILALIGLYPVLVSFGPILEQRMFPIFEVNVLDVKDDGQRINFALTGEKVRSCYRSQYNVFWEVGGVYMPTGLANEDGSPSRLPSVPVGVRFAVGPYYVPVGASIRLGTDVNLVLSFYYDCHPLWQSEQHVIIPVKFISRTTSYQRPLRHPPPPDLRAAR